MEKHTTQVQRELQKERIVKRNAWWTELRCRENEQRRNCPQCRRDKSICDCERN